MTAPRDPGRRLRILYVDYSVGFGGATKSTGLVLRQMPGVEPLILTSQFPDIRKLWYGQWPTYEFRTTMNYRGRALVEGWLDKHVPFAPLRWLALKAVTLADFALELVNIVRIYWMIRRHGIDLVQLCNSVYPTEALVASRLANVPFIAYLAGFFDASDPGARRNAAMAALIIGNSHAVTDGYTAGVDAPRPTATVYPVVDVDAFDRTAHLRAATRRQWQIADDDIAVGLFGRIVPWKGQHEFVCAMIEALKLEPRLKGCLIGDASDGTSSYHSDVIELIRGSGLRERFMFTGYTPEVEPIYAAMDIVVHASIEPEPCGMVIFEGMAAHRPVIATAAGGPLELVEDGVDGRLVPPRDVAAMTAAILDLASDAERRQRMGEKAYEKVRARFDVAVIARQMWTLYGAVFDGSLQKSPLGHGVARPNDALDAHARPS